MIAWWLREVARELKRLGIIDRAQSVTVVFVDPKRGRELNRTYRRKDYATDVLSFEAVEPGSLGELVICPDVVAEQAREHGLTHWQELGYLLIHGVLHLLGYDHEKSRKRAEEMFAIQDRMFESLCARYEAAKSRSRAR